MKEFLNLYKLVWSNYGGNKAFFRGQIVGVAMAFLLGVLPWKFTVIIGAIFLTLNLVTQIAIAMRKTPEGIEPEQFQPVRMAMMVRVTVSSFMYAGFIFAAIMMYVLVSHFVGIPGLPQ